MKISLEKLTAQAVSTGFRPEALGKVAHLLGLLDGLRSHPFLKGKLAMKGGTALNLFVFNVPRLPLWPVTIFKYRDNNVANYSSFTTSFTKIKNSDIQEFVTNLYDSSHYWPAPLNQLNPTFSTEQSSTILLCLCYFLTYTKMILLVNVSFNYQNKFNVIS